MDIPKLITNKALWKYNNSKFHVQTSVSGLHSDLYLNTDYVISDVLLVEEIVKTIFLKELQLRKIKPDWIITYPPFGLAIAYALAKESGAKFGYVDIKANICNFDVKNGDTVIVVGDDIYSGESIKKTINIIDNMGAKIESPIFTIGNFSGTKKLLDLEVLSVISENGDLYNENDCPMCKSGSIAVLPRPNWNKLMEK
jgi:orotate phosphoribosyltransferase